MSEVPEWVTAGRFIHGYMPGGHAERSRRRALARHAGLRSGRKRRQLARARRGNVGPGQRHLPLRYEQRQPSRQEFDRDYDRAFPPPESPQGHAQWLIGKETNWQLLMGVWRLVCARGQHCDSTKKRRAIQLESVGRARKTKTVQRHMRRLERLGYVAFHHVRTPPGQLDYSCVEWRLHRRLPPFDVPHPPGTVNPPSTRGFTAVPEDLPQVEGRASPSLSPPASPADDDGAASPPATERERVEAQIQFVQMRLKFGIGPRDRAQVELFRLREEAKAFSESPPQPRSAEDG